MTLTVAEGQRHTGIAGTGVVLSGLVDNIIHVEDEYTVVELLEIKDFGGSNHEGIHVMSSPSGANSLIQNMIIHDYTEKTAVRTDTVATIRNCVFYNGDIGVRAYGGSGNATVENCTIYNMSSKGVRVDSGGNRLTLRNSIVLGCNPDLYLEGTVDYLGYVMYGTYAITDPETFQGNNQVPPADLDDLFYSIAASSEDLHLEDSGHNAKDTGTDLAGTFTGDIDGETRSAPWDMGADEIAALPLRMASAANQSFTVGDPDTAISAITITDHSVSPTITAADDIRIRIPAGFNMDWDAFDTVATISGSGSSNVSTSVTFEDSDKTLVIDVMSDFAASDSITISDLSFAGFSAASSTDYLTLDIDDDTVADATDAMTIDIIAAAPAPSSATFLISWNEVEPTATPTPTPAAITFDDVTVDVSSTARNSTSFAHTINSYACSSDAVLIVTCMTRGDQGCTDIDYDGITMTKAADELAEAADNREWVSVWYLVNPPTGTNMVNVTFGGAAEDPTAVAAMSYFGVDQTDPIGAIAGNSSTSNSNPCTVNIATTVANSIVVGALAQHGGDTDPHDPGGDVTTEHFDEVSGGATSSDSGYAGGEIATTTTGFYTFECAGNVSDDWAIACVELRPAQ